MTPDALRAQSIALYLDFKMDESYTPNIIHIRSGNSLSDLTVARAGRVERRGGGGAGTRA